MRLLFEPPKRHRRIVMLSALDAALLAVLGLAFLLLDIVFRQVLEPRDVDYLRLLMAASWIVVFILEVALAYLRQ
jgi:hypothetical protein